MRVDAHHHLWDPARRAQPWMDGPWADPIRRAFTLADLLPELDAHAVDATVVVQACSSYDETRELLRLAGESERVAGVVGWADLTDPGLPAVLDGLRSGPGGRRLVGIRHQVQDEPDADWLGRPDAWEKNGGDGPFNDRKLARIVFAATLSAAVATSEVMVRERATLERVAERLAACVNRIPGIASTYRWKGQIQHDTESLLVIKTTRDRFEAVRERILALHQYELPEVLAVDIAAGHAPYLDWIAAQSAPDAS